MSEKIKTLPEIKSRSSLNTYLGHVAKSAEIDIGDYLQLVEHTTMPIAVYSLIAHYGQEVPTSTDKELSIRIKGTKFIASNSFNGSGITTSLISTTRRHAFGYINKKLLSLNDMGIKGAVASHNPDHQNLFYMLDKCAPDLSDGYPSDCLNLVAGDVPRVTSLAILAAEDKVKKHEILQGFIKVSSELIAGLLEKTS